MEVMIAGRQFWQWRAVGDGGEVLDVLVQRRRDKAAAVELRRKLIKKRGFVPEMPGLVDMPRIASQVLPRAALPSFSKICSRRSTCPSVS
jgi:transposase-like protein